MKAPNNNTGVFQGALANLTPMLTPYGQQAVMYANGSANGNQAKQAFNSRVTVSQTNGGGPNVAPVNAPWSFQGFALGLKDIGPSVAGKVSGRVSILTMLVYGLAIVVLLAIAWRFIRK
jgi:hypothetical protein